MYLNNTTRLEVKPQETCTWAEVKAGQYFLSNLGEGVFIKQENGDATWMTRERAFSDQEVLEEDEGVIVTLSGLPSLLVKETE